MSINDLCSPAEQEECKKVVAAHFFNINQVYEYFSGYFSSGSVALISESEVSKSSSFALVTHCRWHCCSLVPLSQILDFSTPKRR